VHLPAQQNSAGRLAFGPPEESLKFKGFYALETNRTSDNEYTHSQQNERPRF